MNYVLKRFRTLRFSIWDSLKLHQRLWAHWPHNPLHNRTRNLVKTNDHVNNSLSFEKNLLFTIFHLFNICDSQCHSFWKTFVSIVNSEFYTVSIGGHDDRSSLYSLRFKFTCDWIFRFFWLSEKTLWRWRFKKIKMYSLTMKRNFILNKYYLLHWKLESLKLRKRF